jgi:hypothetical protein
MSMAFLAFLADLAFFMNFSFDFLSPGTLKAGIRREKL